MLAGNPLFEPLTLTVDAGKWTALLGASGVGKTTVLRLIAGLKTAADFKGTIRAGDGKELEGRVAYMAQTDLLLPWANVMDNVTIGARLRHQQVDQARAERVIDSVGLGAHAGKFPATLSGGQRQRVALARTLMEDRPVVLLDEPFSALDARTRSEMQELASELLVNRTVLLVTHDPAEAARLGHSIYILTPGALACLPGLPLALPCPVTDMTYLTFQASLLDHLRRGE
jgi:putative hydroxymethylpyrimidine transport system ATP-binding protein